MSLSPQFPSGAEPEPELAARPAFRWYHKVGAVLFAIFCFELGVFLLIFPWTDFWQRNLFATWTAEAQLVWMSPYFRGMVSGLGLVNIFVSFIEVVRLRRFAA